MIADEEGEWHGKRRRSNGWRVACGGFEKKRRLLASNWLILGIFAFDGLVFTSNALLATRTASFAGAVIIESVTWRPERRWISRGPCIRCVGSRRQIGSCSDGLRQDRAWSELRRTSPWTNPENVQNLSSSAARNLPSGA